MSFEAAVRSSATAALRAACKQGKSALEARHRPRITCSDPARITASVDLDKALVKLPAHAQAPRWDYGLGHREAAGAEVAVWVEVHTASMSEVTTVLRKLDWLKHFLRSDCADVWKLTLKGAKDRQRFVWIAASGVHINRNSPQARRLASAGLRLPHSQLQLP